jgi:Regulator of chromosome condensation (RCC1) repeat
VHSFNFSFIKLLALSACLLWSCAARAELFAGKDGTLWERDEAASSAKLFKPLDLAAPVAMAAAGIKHSVALDREGNVWAWGDNSAGQLGTGDFKASARPVRINAPAMAAVAAGAWHTVALDREGNVWAWGSNALGQMGGKPGKFSVSTEPRKVEGLEHVTDIYARENFTLAQHSDGTVAGWGMLPDAKEPSLPHPVKIMMPKQAAAAFDFSGKVMAEGKPVAEAEVYVDGELCGRTDRRGKYRCVLPAGFAGAVKAQKEGFEFGSAKIAKVTKGLANQIIFGRKKAEKTVKTKTGAEPQVVAKKASAMNPETAAKQQAPVNPAAPERVAPSVKPTDIPEVREKDDVKLPLVKEAAKEAPVQKKEEPRAVRIAGVIRLESGQPLVGVAVRAEAAECGVTNARGEYACTAPVGWSGRLVAAKPHYKFSPRALNYRDVREDRGGQDLTAVYEPD